MPESIQQLKLPPQNIDAEIAVLGALLIDKDAIIKVADVIKPEDFYKHTNGVVFQAIIDLYANRSPIDIMTVASRLEEQGALESIGGRSYLVNLANAVTTAANVVAYAEIVQKKSTLRKLISVAGEISQLGFSESEQVEELLDQAEQKIFTVSQKFLKQNFVPIKSLLLDAFDRIDEMHRESGKIRGIPSGFTELDNKLSGFQKSDLIILAARPSMGKTSLAMDFVRHAATREKVPCGIFSLEMSKEQITERLICAEANVDSWKLRTGRLSDKEEYGESDFSKINRAMGVLSESPIFIDDSPVINVMEIRTKARRLQAEHGLGLIMIDYLQLMESSSDEENRVQEIAKITRGLKGIARELNVPVIAISQLSRAVENRPGSIPRLADLRESGSIEQDADVVLFIYREKMYKKDTPKGNIAEVYIAKHRNGPLGVIEIYFDEEKASFKNLERQRNDIPTQPPI